MVMAKTISSLLDSQDVSNGKNDTVVSLLKESLKIHWEQIHALTSQAEHFERWGYFKLAAIIKADSEEEHIHATVNLKRLEFFDEGSIGPVSPPEWPRHDMVGIIMYNLASVRKAQKAEQAIITEARKIGDEITANIIIPLLQGSENGIIQYEAYMKLINEMGIDNFLTLQV